MTMLDLTAPAPLIGDNLAAEITAAGFTNVRVMAAWSAKAPAGSSAPDRVLIYANNAAGEALDNDDGATIATVVAAHTGKPTAEQQQAADDAQALDDLRAKASAGTALTPDDISDAVRLLLGAQP